MLSRASSLDDFEISRTSKQRLQSSGAELHPKPLITHPGAGENLDPRNHADSPFGALAMSKVHSLREGHGIEHGECFGCGGICKSDAVDAVSAVSTVMG